MVYPVLRGAEPNPAISPWPSSGSSGGSTASSPRTSTTPSAGWAAAERVIELHGSAMRARCLDCDRPYDRAQIQDWLEAGVSVPICDPPCGGVIKPRTIMFGEAMPSEETEEAERRSRAADLFIVVGSSLVVYPAPNARPRQAGRRASRHRQPGADAPGCRGGSPHPGQRGRDAGGHRRARSPSGRSLVNLFTLLPARSRPCLSP